ncbi:extensin family protein [Chondromyces apiculatus]|uniref:Extensin-like protein n=1 Tax=Chondromyces apiculatus DSM 436 TaxID=1192034 RepID=A0A017T6H4_9BACT|nr:extensin family protein [Chondromyces apiculatus]EYF04171.1 Extensin-like protein [Chondromyces apiculatus DSM 436]
MEGVGSDVGGGAGAGVRARALLLLLVAVVALLLPLAVAPPAAAANRYAIEPPDAMLARAYRYGAMESEHCLALLALRDVPFQPVAPTRGVDTPVRLTGFLHGVRFVPIDALAPPEKDDRTIADCRLVLALDDLASVLAEHQVVRAEYFSMYRRRGAGFMKRGMRHPGGRAIDLVNLVLADGKTYGVRGDFQGMRGVKTCGDGAAKPRRDTPGARLWRAVVCETSALRSFNLILSPNHDWAHRDHLHMEVRSGIKWILVQ